MVGIVTVEFFIVHKKSLRNKLGKVKKSKLVASFLRGGLIYLTRIFFM